MFKLFSIYIYTVYVHSGCVVHYRSLCVRQVLLASMKLQATCVKCRIKEIQKQPKLIHIKRATTLYNCHLIHLNVLMKRKWTLILRCKTLGQHRPCFGPPSW